MNDPTKATKLFPTMLSAVLHILVIADCLADTFSVNEVTQREDDDVGEFIQTADDPRVREALQVWEAPGNAEVLYQVVGGGEAVIGNIMVIFNEAGEVQVISGYCM